MWEVINLIPCRAYISTTACQDQNQNLSLSFSLFNFFGENTMGVTNSVCVCVKQGCPIGNVVCAYGKVICCACIGNRLSDSFNSTIDVKQGSPLSPTLFGLCTNELEEMVVKFVKEECVEEVAIGNVVIMLLLYADDVVLFANTLGDAQKLMKALEKNCMHTKLSVHNSKTMIILVKSQKIT